MNTSWTGSLAWLLAVSAALALALAAPNDSSVMGQLPSFMARTPNRRAVAVPDGLPAERTLALITFRGNQRAHINRQGKVLARTEGAFDAAKADKLRETLQPQGTQETSRPPAGASPRVK